VLEQEQLVPRPLEEVAAFFEDPRRLADITPPWLAFQINRIDGLPMRVGTRIEYRVRPLAGIPVPWKAEIVEYEPRRRFVDVQVSGPYRLWRHEHTFEPVDGATLVRDRVEYELPFGLLARPAHALVVARQLRRIFEFREAKVRELFG
jgi:ligand-binding SRPBCC domain-containing protein